MADDNRVIRGPQDSDARILVPQERVLSRNSGCWNCIWMRDAEPFWKERRQRDLNKAVVISEDSFLGENHPKVINIRRMVDFVDRAVAKKALLRCAGKGVLANGDDIGDLVANSFMCRKWTGATGSSMARQGERINDLPEEIRDNLDGNEAATTARLAELAAQVKKVDDE